MSDVAYSHPGGVFAEAGRDATRLREELREVIVGEHRQIGDVERGGHGLFFRFVLTTGYRFVGEGVDGRERAGRSAVRPSLSLTPTR